MGKIIQSSKHLAQKEALFNEVKGSLFEYLVARQIAHLSGNELLFQSQLDQNYLNVLSQQDRMVRQFYPEMLSFLNVAAKQACEHLMIFFSDRPTSARVVGKFSNTKDVIDLNESDILVEIKGKSIPISLKLNKKNSYVNTKSGGIRSFFDTYFPTIDPNVQKSFNSFVDTEFNRMSFELHALKDMDFLGDFKEWTARGFSELPGELDLESRNVLKSYYSRIAQRMHHIFEDQFLNNSESTYNSLPALLGFSSQEIIQVIYFHNFPDHSVSHIEIHKYEDILKDLNVARLLPFNQTSSLEIQIGNYSLQVRVKPMNKFTTTAIKINCSVKFKQSSTF